MSSAVRRGASHDRTCPDSGKSAIQCYGWDARSGTWHGPSQLGLAGARSQRLEDALQGAHGPSWFGSVSCFAPGEPVTRFFVVVHDLTDCAVTTIYCEESKTGPVEIVAAIPAERRALLRQEFAFEFLAFSGFLGSLKGGTELEVSEAIAAALAETPASDSLVISISTGLWASDLDHILSRCVEETAVAVLHWLDHVRTPNRT